MPGTLYLGTSNVVVPERSKALFPTEFQAGTRLTYYGSLFNSVEINSTFYRLSQPKTLIKWAAEVPADFRFTLKLWRAVTHNKGFVYREEDLERFFEMADQMPKKGALLIQLPPKLTDDYVDHLEKLLDTISDLDPDRAWPLAVEFRNLSWYQDHVYSLLDAHRGSVVLHDMATGTVDVNEEAPFIYMRYHGPNGGDYRGSYEPDFLEEQSHAIRGWLAQGKDVYVYFNNTMGTASQDALTLKSLVMKN